MPRSPSRDLSDRYTGNRRYFRSWNPLERGKMFGALIAAVVTLGGIAVVYALNSKTPFSHGPLANPHAAWDQTCEACHRPQPASAVANLFGTRDRWHDLTCEKCHAAPAHNSRIPTGDSVERCETCHRDHNGRDFSLVRIGDSHCLQCHGPGGRMAVSTTIANFATSHPEFGSLQQRKSTLKFSHAVHLSPGMVRTEGARGAWTLKQISAEQREKYRQSAGQSDDAIVQLDCKSCHQLTGSPAANVAPSAGNYFTPITFDNHCKACHPTATPDVVSKTQLKIGSFEIPHKTALKDVDPLLTGEYARRLLGQHPALKEPETTFDPKQPRSTNPAVAAFQDDVTAAKEMARKTLLEQSCAKCHTGLPTEIQPTAIPAVWMTKAKFDHLAHRATDCKSCHPKTGGRYVGNEPDAKIEREPVNILGLESCRECHQPRDGSRGGVRHDCVTCHTFHHGGGTPLSRGAAAFAPAEPLDIREFLKGIK